MQEKTMGKYDKKRRQKEILLVRTDDDKDQYTGKPPGYVFSLQKKKNMLYY